jgi:iron complex transport system substrate-binding protein
MRCDGAGWRSSRRGALACVVAALVLVAACGGGEGGARSASGAASDDRRVVVLAEEFVLADVLDVGVRPIASTASVAEVGFQGLDDHDTSGIEVLPMTTLSLEHLASLRPDVIVTLQFWVDQIGEDALRGMAELLVIPDGSSVPDRLTALGDLFDRPDQAASVVAELDEATERASETVPDDCTVSLTAIYPGPNPAAFVAGPWDLPTSVLSTGCALDPDATVAAPDENGRVYLSMEQLGILDAPRLVLLQSETVAGEQDAVDEIATHPLWSELPAVRAGNVTVFDRLGYPGASGQIRFLEEFAALFA